MHLRDYRELLEVIQQKIEGMPTNIAAVPGAVKKLLNEWVDCMSIDRSDLINLYRNSNVFNNLRQPQMSVAQTQQQQTQQPTHTFKPDIKVPLNNGSTTTNSITGRVTRSGAHVF